MREGGYKKVLRTLPTLDKLRIQLIVLEIVIDLNIWVVKRSGVSLVLLRRFIFLWRV